MPNHVEWHGEAAKEHVRKKIIRALNLAAQACSRRAKELLSVSGTGVQTKGGSVVRKVKGGPRGKAAYGAFPSSPGEPPHKQLGTLRASVNYDVDEANLSARVGTNEAYGKYLELGTSRGLKPRPWLRRALAETASQINSILGGIGRD